MSGGETYIERMVPRQPTAGIRLVQVSFCLMPPILAFVCWSFPPTSSFAVFVLVGACFGAWQLFIRQNVEFEYALTNGEMDIDKIIARRARKRLLSIDCRRFEILAPVVSEFSAEINERNIVRRLDFSSSSQSEGRWFAIFMDQDNQRTILFFEPDQRMLDAFRTFIPRKVQQR